MIAPPVQDLDRSLHAVAGTWEHFRGARVFLTGGTGFFGGWLLDALLRADDLHGLQLSVTVLTRDPDAFRAARPRHATHRAVTLLAGDVLTLQPPRGPFTHLLHAATPASLEMNLQVPRLMFDTIVEGTRRVLEVARLSGARRFLLTSSGAVYGRQPPELEHVTEAFTGAPDPCAPGAAYGEGKRTAELLSTIAGREHGFDAVIARCFAFAGPYLPLDAHYAIGNFVRDAVAGGPIRVRGDGTPFRSYLYGADLAAWLWTMLATGAAAHPYNVGSEQAISIGQLAATVARELGVRDGVEIAAPPVAGRSAERYVPSTRRAREELGLAEHFTLVEAIHRMADAAGRPRRI